MAQKILLINPAKKPSQRRKKKRTAAQIRATKKLVALNKRRAKAKRKPNPSKRTKPMAAQKRRKRRTAAQRAATRKLVAFNKRRRSGTKRRRKNPVSRRRRAYRATPVMARKRNPIRRRRRRNPITTRNIMNKAVIPAIQGATGALALDIAYAYLPIPANIKTGPMAELVKGGSALALFGFLAPMVVKKSTADTMLVGALTVITHQAARKAIAQFAPQVKMDGMGYYSAGLPVGGYGNGNGDMGIYVADQAPAMPVPDMGHYNEYDEMGVYVG